MCGVREDADNALETAINTHSSAVVVPTTPTNPQQMFLPVMMLNNNNNNSNTPINVTLNSPIQQQTSNKKDIELGNVPTELVINNDEKTQLKLITLVTTTIITI